MPNAKPKSKPKSLVRTVWILAILLTISMVWWISIGPVAVNAQGGPALFSANPPAWRILSYEASKLFITASTTVTLEVDAKVPADLYTPAAGKAGVHKPIPATRIDHRLTLETQTMGRRSVETVFFDSGQGSAVQRHKRRFGNKGYSKTHRFLNGGVVVRRSAPAEGSSSSEEKNWTDIQETLFPLPDSGGCRVVIDPLQIFYLLSASDLKNPGDFFEVCVFSKKSFGLMKAEVTAISERKTDYRLDDRPASGKSRVIAISLTSSPLKGQTDEEKIELIGLEGDLEVFLDAESRVPVEICGDHSKLGSISVRLVDAKTSKLDH